MWGKEMGKWLAEDTTALDYSAIIRLHIRCYYCSFMEGYSICIGKASTLRVHCRRAKKNIINDNVKWCRVRRI